MFKRIAAGSMIALSLASILSIAPTTQVDAAKKKIAMKELNVQFVPSSQADTIAAKVKPLEGLLKKQLGVPVHVTISTDYNTIVEAMGSKKVDMGFLPPAGYVQAHEQYGAKVILQSQRLGLKDDNTGANTDKLVNYYKAMVLVRKDAKINSIKDLKGKKIAVQDTTSDAGYMFPAIDLKKKGVNILKNNTQLVTVKGHDQGVLSVLNHDTDAAFVFDDARNIVKKDNPDVFKQTKVLMYTAKIPNDTISLRKGISKKDAKTIQNAMISVSKSKTGKQVMNDVYSWAGVTKSKDSNFDIVRQYHQAVEDMK
ncbi:phosphate/phosphite/phosphonate ABC transporter substrate-binding protein [Weissella diestrammenae]|uniref:Phosphate/phosphite/phosphonate ABC transporter substrate-binding protein n=1 Tax=Weissella diestrammenae TaxID=1162633 RepID=A0A7G9T703_9LACO|nr:phosphate/phosphite/phosphonate ABC transporter substrate-binding protein [Weissella diestrammenae]MCM0582525.1 phosphate/phosphite/phosphonate ABC transporter substrate-binding protein [Weissella diestrammenae]QNN75878.1 phosphate/phosphite/phosphonate ABC transporter substrate-binding protein [Weissella diestrammenae]